MAAVPTLANPGVHPHMMPFGCNSGPWLAQRPQPISVTCARHVVRRMFPFSLGTRLGGVGVMRKRGFERMGHVGWPPTIHPHTHVGAKVALTWPNGQNGLAVRVRCIAQNCFHFSPGPQVGEFHPNSAWSKTWEKVDLEVTGGGGGGATSTALGHQRRGSANAETTPAGAPAAAADRTHRPDATCEGKNGWPPVKKQRRDGMSHRGGEGAFRGEVSFFRFVAKFSRRSFCAQCGPCLAPRGRQLTFSFCGEALLPVY